MIGCVILLALVGGLIYALRLRKDPANEIRAAARTYAKAMSGGDLNLLAASTTGDEASLQTLAAQARQNVAYERLTAAARKRFGDDRAVLSGRRAQDHVSNLAGRIDSEPVEAKEDEARLGYLWLKRVDGSWKVDRSRLVPPTPPGGDPMSHVVLVDALARAYNETADSVETNVVQDADEARTMFVEKTRDAIESVTRREARVPASRPSTRISLTR